MVPGDLRTSLPTASHGGIVADFPLAQLGQEQLEQAFGEIAFEGEEA